MNLHLSAPRSALPAVFTGRPTGCQLGFIAAPSMLNDPDSDQNPIGTGPFKLQSRTLDNQTTFVRNEDYWRDGYPYLDSITFRIIPETQTRIQALIAGETDVAATGRAMDALTLEDTPGIEFYRNDLAVDTSFLIINTEKPPFDDLRVRQALAHATDRETYLATFGEGIAELANSPWPADSKWHPDTEPLPYDLDRARALVDEWEAETGQQLKVTLGTGTDPYSRQVLELVQDQWKQAGIDVDIKTTEGSQIILDTLLGDYEVNLWGQYGNPDPDVDSVWWLSENTEGLALNFSRLRDERVDAALRAAQATDDFEERKARYQIVAEVINEVVPHVWLAHGVYGVAWREDVHDVITWDFPDGGEGAATLGATYSLHQIWKES
ncbi:MAG: ABC transporter substrate-binding protein [Acidimicrobiia bacterium]|nr:ABC transporter substrate-binding protein [Acidimicrobiia bacterium]